MIEKRLGYEGTRRVDEVLNPIGQVFESLTEIVHLPPVVQIDLLDRDSIAEALAGRGDVVRISAQCHDLVDLVLEPICGFQSDSAGFRR
jgi:hypothetical protein